MSQDLIKAIEDAIKETQEWPTKGWKQRFGNRGTEVNSFDAAKDLEDTFVYKIEAVAYWTNVKNASEEAVEWGRKAIEAAKAGKLKDADDMVYYALVVEKPLRSKPVTWNKVYSMIKQNAA